VTYSVFVPAVQHGTALPVQRFFIATPGDPVAVINAALARGQDLILIPGVYDLRARRPGGDETYRVGGCSPGRPGLG
jgi:hypothetical protein